LKKILILILLSVSSTSCKTAQDSSLLGAGFGAVLGGGAGAAIGKNFDDEAKGAAVGIAAGAALGGLAGYLEHTDRVKSHFQSQFHTPSNSDSPALTVPQVRRLWVPDRIEGQKYIRGHFVYSIDRQSNWRMKGKHGTNKESKRETSREMQKE
jgi:uncharacterized protein YcfJ